MSNLLEQASLVMIPSGYKEDIVYSEIPINGSGDMTLTRASNGTRINSAGLVEVTPWNLASYSEDFSNAVWTVSNATITSNSIVAPNGTTTADTINGTTIGAEPRARQTTAQIGSSVYSLSCYAKKGTVDWVILRNIAVNNGGGSRAWFNLNTGVVGTTNSGISATIESVGNGWYRCAIYGTTDASPTNLIDIAPAPADNDFTTNASGENVYVWGAQLNIGSTAKPYFPTTDRLNVPRLTYQNGGGGCPSLLLEKQSTNVLTYSEQFDNAGWTKADVTVTANAITSPDGTQNADKIVENTANSAHGIYQSATITSGASWTWSGFFKAGGRTRFRLYAQSASTPYVEFNLSNGTIIGTSGSVTGSVESVGNDWYRCIATTTTSGTTGYFNIAIADASGNISYTGDGTSGIYIWGAQIEASSYPTSLINTTSSSATRVADAIGNQTTSIAQAFTDNTKGTIFFDLKNIKFQGGPEARFQFGDSADSLRFAFFMDAVGLGVYGYQGGGYAVNVSTATNQKIAIRFDGTSLTGFSQGVKRNTVTSGTNYVIEQMIGNNTANLCFEMNEFVLFNSVLTDAECIALTTL